MRLLILGSEGFIGQHLVKHFLRNEFEVSGCDVLGSPANSHYDYTAVSPASPGWENVLGGKLFDVCINAAGSGNVGASVERPFEDFAANSIEPFRILEAIRITHKECKYLHISSAAVYGNPQSLPIKEDSALQPISPYGWHKLISETICKEYFRLYGIQTGIVRPFSVYGPGLKKQLLWDIYKKTISESKQIELWGTGEESRDFIYIEDLVKAISTIILNAKMDGTSFNIASGTETTVRSLVNILLSTLGCKKEVIFNQKTKSGDPLHWRADIGRLVQLGFKPEYPLEMGIRKYVEWIGELD